MSEPKLISPLLSDHMMGDPISSHHGSSCCPAIKKDSDDKYIVKILSIPASQVQLDALLLTGAYSSKEAALAYFKELTDSAVEEAEVLKKLSQIEGFCSYEGWQIVPMEDATGYDLYLLGAYRPTLEWHFKSNPMTHLAAVNLGLDLCAALSVCRRNGYLYVDLKPGNVFLTGNQEYRIGDLGFIRLDSLKYASLPDRYRSAYTAPEIADAYSSLNTTLDIYAAGLILYQAYNNGLLPVMDGDEPLPPPAYADYEMAQIILKACARNPEDRWQDPAEMGQELAEYMQRNSVNDVPIIPPAVTEAPVEEPEEATEAEEAAEEVTEEATEAEEIPQDAPVEETEPEEAPVEETEPEDTEAEEPPVEETEEAEAEETEDEEQFVIDGFETDETAPSEEDLQDLEDAAVSDETSVMLAQADELIDHETPGPVVVPEPMEITLPEPEMPEETPEETTETEDSAPEEEPPAAEPEEAAETEDDAQADPGYVDEEDYTDPKRNKKHNTPVIILSTILVLLLLAVGIYTFYENYYVQLVQNITVSSEFGEMTVKLDTQVDNELLRVVCQDTYGNKLTADVVDNTAHFTGITSNTHYKITVEVSGFHRLIGTTSANHTTDAQTNIVEFTAKTGEQAGSVVLNFSVQGEDNFAWRIYYSTPGEEEKTVECNGHMATVTGLTVGSTYTFRLAPVVDLHVVGTDTVTYTASDLIYPESLAIKGFNGGNLKVTWKAPKDVTVDGWIVRCYNADGFNASFNVDTPEISIEGLDPAQSYTIDVKADNMTVSKWVSLTANSVTVKNIKLDDSKPGEMTINWGFEGTAPEGGWRLFYTVDGGEKHVIHCDTTSCTIAPLVPGGSYVVSFQLDGDITVFGGKTKFSVPESEKFDSYGVTWENFSFRMCWTPDNADWRWYNLYESDFTNTFKVGEKASFVLRLDTNYHDDQDDIETLFVVRDADGKVISANTGRTRIWVAMWDQRYSELDMPAMPQKSGDYTVDIYFNGALVTTEKFTVTE
ncbi:MAG: fibronectin type III domain-containing protein [Oscillospiraceae bacterium]|nr:fibronectin type III domain-containing protein [Oscillospiraceae bacterium]